VAAYRESFVVYVACDPPAVFWLGNGRLPLAADAVIPSSVIAIGAGRIINIPDFQELINGTAERLQLGFSGVSDETVALALEEASQVRNAPLWLGLVSFDEDWQQDGPVQWEQLFQLREMSVSRQNQAGVAEQTITITVASGETARSKAPNNYFTDADQRRKYPTDAIFSHVAAISQGTSRRWGPR
jgi:hypothetical protein